MTNEYETGSQHSFDGSADITEKLGEFH